jgi:hypothetical protein
MPKGLGTQIVAGILGLLFIIGLVLLGRKIGQDLKSRFLAKEGSKIEKSITPTPPLNALIGISPTAAEKITHNSKSKGEAISTQTKGEVKEIPKTGSEYILLTTLLIPAGYYLRKKS